MIITFEPHATTFDNEAKVVSGWNDVALSPKGLEQAKELGKRYKLSDLDAIYCADLQRAYRTAELAFPDISKQKLFIDWRLRECHYGDMTLKSKDIVEAEKINRISKPFPNGESYNQAMARMKSFIDDLRTKGHSQALIIGSRATHYGLDHWIDGKDLEQLVTAHFAWQPGWRYELRMSH